MKKPHVAVTLVVSALSSACDDAASSATKVYPSFENIPSSPYTDPVWHPSGGMIGFNYKPIKEIDYYSGYGKPLQARYLYEKDSSGFWLINADGTKKRRSLSFHLLCPAWSPDGSWMAFVDGSQIFKMPFDGESFDTTAIVQLTFEGRNFFPAWSPDGSMIAYDNTDCGSATTPRPPNGCGMLVMNADGSNKRFIASDSRMPYWSNTNEYLYSFNSRHHPATGTSEVFFDVAAAGVLFTGQPRASWDTGKIGFVGRSANGGFLNLYSVDFTGKNFTRISHDTIQNFSWGPGNLIVYQKFDNIRIDRTKGTLWIMDAAGRNPKPLTFNNFVVSNQHYQTHKSQVLRFH